MNEIITTSAHPISNLRSPTTRLSSSKSSALIALPELPITVRLATMDDIPFIDGLQKKNNKSLGFMNRPTLEGKIKRDEILIAEEGAACIGYLIGNDRYFKRDELGAIFQLCVEPGRRRGLVGATLLKALFERASYGCKLYCCWCAQDLEANHFWEAMGFVPVAFRSGAKKKLKGKDGKLVDRVHIFWQKRIRAGDTETPWWYPHETGGGAINEDRIVLPIPPNVHWSQVKSVVVPGDEAANDASGEASRERLAISDQSESNAEIPTPSAEVPTSNAEQKSKRSPKSKSNPTTQNSKPATGKKEPYTLRCSAIYFAPPVVEKPKAEKVKKEKPPKVKKKNDPEKVKAARYLRDRYTEEINRGDYLVSNGKYDVSRLIENVALPKGAVPVDQKLLAA